MDLNLFSSSLEFSDKQDSLEKPCKFFLNNKFQSLFFKNEHTKNQLSNAQNVEHASFEVNPSNRSKKREKLLKRSKVALGKTNNTMKKIKKPKSNKMKNFMKRFPNMTKMKPKSFLKSSETKRPNLERQRHFEYKNKDIFKKCDSSQIVESELDSDYLFSKKQLSEESCFSYWSNKSQNAVNKKQLKAKKQTRSIFSKKTVNIKQLKKLSSKGRVLFRVDII